MKIKSNLPDLKAVVQIAEPFADYAVRETDIWRWSDLMEMETDDVELEYHQRLSEVTANECCALLYTSGTTGNPKAVMLSHDNFTWTAKAVAKRLQISPTTNEVFMSYLPLSHMAGQILDVFLSLTVAATVFCGDKDAIKSSFLQIMVDVRPTLFIGVPRIYEKIQNKTIIFENRSGLLKKCFDFIAKSVALQYHLSNSKDNLSSSVLLKLANSFTLHQKKVALGLERCRNLLTAAAPMSQETKKYFLSLDLRIKEMYGMTEVTVQCMSTKDSPLFFSIGKSLEGTQAKVLNPNADGSGEIYVKGRNVFMGYLDDTQKTFDTVDADGWMHTGDSGFIDQNGVVYITGRLKEIIITSGGENVQPIYLENLVKAECSALSNVILVGDGRKYLTMLVTLKTLMNSDGSPSDELASESISWLEQLGLKHRNLTEILVAGPDPIFMQSIQQAINRANLKSVSNAQKVQKFAILPHDFSAVTGELGPSMKLKRNLVLEKYKKTIDKLYN